MPEASTNKQERQSRILETLETMINDDRTQKSERDAAKARWEHITGEKWTGKCKASQQNTRQSGTNSKKSQSSSGPTVDEKFWEDVFGKGFGKGFNSKSNDNPFKYAWEQRQKQREYGPTSWDYSYDSKEYDDPRTQSKKTGRDYDFGFNPCTDKQYDYLDAICKFFRWKHPEHCDISFEEASSFLNKYSNVFNAFKQEARNVTRLKELFEAFGVKWDMTKRTWEWEHERKGGRL